MPVGIVLAAGKGQRFGADKRLQPLAGGELLVTRSIVNAMAALPKVYVVLGEHDQHIRDTVLDALPVSATAGLVWVFSPESSQGMGHSLAAGVEVSRHADGWVVLLGDMPCIQPATIRDVARALQHAPLVRPVYQGSPGHPVAFSSPFAKALSCLRGDQGARGVLDENRQSLLLLSVSDPGVLHDVDTPDDLSRLNAG